MTQVVPMISKTLGALIECTEARSLRRGPSKPTAPLHHPPPASLSISTNLAVP
ncbi:Protein WEAK CHLOROPLAST MOVEMENT UNDER BLUE LIGHT-like 3 [Clarias magur]|uniref:Protein WEAK CHLOROPLAST MOVEMENT UNDER BLUE LIGHT-like 3 n=1 Tax=Clarias magur TaxID=1594786 RepID=A0A8J4TMJ9_CLAMG|nr:Protein WEAK CHLOROPLAST MOVEMENT UNDER BLUE LIGHT-like 3 [Clarias magur]